MSSVPVLGGRVALVRASIATLVIGACLGGCVATEHAPASPLGAEVVGGSVVGEGVGEWGGDDRDWSVDDPETWSWPVYGSRRSDFVSLMADFVPAYLALPAVVGRQAAMDDAHVRSYLLFAAALQRQPEWADLLLAVSEFAMERHRMAGNDEHHWHEGRLRTAVVLRFMYEYPSDPRPVGAAASQPIPAMHLLRPADPADVRHESTETYPVIFDGDRVRVVHLTFGFGGGSGPLGNPISEYRRARETLSLRDLSAWVDEGQLVDAFWESLILD